VNASRQRPREGVRPYDSTRERREPNLPPKKEVLISLQAINEVLSKVYCPKNCLQPFPQAKIIAIHIQIYIDGNVFFRKHHLFDVHKQIHIDATEKEMITLEGIKVCPTTCWPSMGCQGLHFTDIKRWQNRVCGRSLMATWGPKSLGCKHCRLLPHCSYYSRTLQITCPISLKLWNWGKTLCLCVFRRHFAGFRRHRRLTRSMRNLICVMYPLADLVKFEASRSRNNRRKPVVTISLGMDNATN